MMLNPKPLSPLRLPMNDEGVTKYRLTLTLLAPFPAAVIVPLEKWRAILWRMGFIGEYPIEKVGYGNLSLRLPPPANAFIITGTQTGHRPHLGREHYTRVTDCDLQRNSVKAEGPIAPSSESLTHWALYAANPQIQCVFHVHHPQMWEHLLKNGAPKVGAGIGYGTKEMATAAAEVIQGQEEGHFVMEGHQDGIMAWGATPDAAGKILLKLHRELGRNPTEN